MKRKNTANNKGFRCMDCVHATPVFEQWNLDYQTHAPICYRCKFITNRLVIRSDKACEKFRKK